MWPTPTGRDYKDGTAKSCENVPVNGLLGRAVHLWRTPDASMDRGAISEETYQRREAEGLPLALNYQVAHYGRLQRSVETTTAEEVQ